MLNAMNVSTMRESISIRKGLLMIVSSMSSLEKIFSPSPSPLRLLIEIFEQTPLTSVESNSCNISSVIAINSFLSTTMLKIFTLLFTKTFYNGNDDDEDTLIKT